MRTPLIAGNWKMYKTVGDAVAFVRQLAGVLSVPPDREIAVAPPFTALHAVSATLKETAVAIRLAAQNVYPEPCGAFTGEVSAAMLAEAGCEYVIIGHSERRTLFHETDDLVNRKIAAVLSCGLKPLFCIGETLEERELNETFSILARQITQGLRNRTGDDIRKITIAYEPVWAIGTGRTASPAQAQEVHGFIRKTVDSLFGDGVSQELRILYGGSVNAGNIRALMDETDIDGALVGGASLDVESFSKIVNY